MITNKNSALPPPLFCFAGALDFAADAFLSSPALVSGFDMPVAAALALLAGLSAGLPSFFAVVSPDLTVPEFGTLDLAVVPVSAALADDFALPLLSTEMVSDDSLVSADFAEALVFGVSGVFTIRPLQFAVIPKTASGAGSHYDRDPSSERRYSCVGCDATRVLYHVRSDIFDCTAGLRQIALVPDKSLSSL